MKNIEIKIEMFEEKLNKLEKITDNIQVNYLNLSHDLNKINSNISETNKLINTIMIQIATIQNDIQWIKKIKTPVIAISGFTGLGGIIYAIYEIFKGR